MLFKYLKPFWPGVIVIVALLLIQSLSELFLPTLMSVIVNDGIIYGVQHGVYQTDFILRTGGTMLMVALFAGLASVTATYISPKIAAGVARNLRRDIFTKVENFSQAEFDKFSSASLITRCTNDVSQIQVLANIFARTFLYAPIIAFGGIFMALRQSVSMGWIIALSVIVLFGLVAIVISIVMPRFKIIQELTDKLNKVSREILHGLMVIRSFGTQNYEKQRFSNANKDLADLGLFIGRVMAINGPAITFVMGGTQMLIIWVGASYVGDVNYDLSVGDMMAFFQYAMQVIISFMMISFVIVMVPRAQVSATRIKEVLDTNFSINDPENPINFNENSQPDITFKNVSFNYPNSEANALENISFTAHAGQTTAIIGSTGSGKSTIAQLILRFYDVSNGSVTINNTDIRHVRQEELRKKIGYVPQKGQLLSGTIESNIRYGKPNATVEEVELSAKIAQAYDFIDEKEHKFESEISQGGTNVSGGQRQRLSIARALAKKPEIIVFDDSFSALDFQTDLNLRKALHEHTADATVIVIAQRVGTIMNAEQIIVLDEGKIVGKGTHNQLMNNCPAYQEIALSQDINMKGEI